MSKNPPPEEFPPWRDRRFVIFATGNFLNNLGEGAYKVALPLYVYELTGSLATMSLVAALGPLMLLLGPWLGAAADRFGARLLVVPGLLVQLTAAVALNLAAGADRLPMWLLFTLVAFVQLGGELYRTGWITAVPHMFPDNAARSRAVLSSLFVTSNVVGPLLVAAGLGWVGYLGLLWFNTATFLAPIVVWLIGVHPPRVERVDGPRPGLTRDIVEGWRIVRGTPQVFRLEMMSLPLQFASGIGVLAFLVWYLRDHAQVPAQTVGVAQAAFNIGALVGSLYIAARAKTRPDRVLAACAFVMTGALFAMTIPATPVLIAVMVVFFTLRSAMTAVTAMIMVKYLPATVIGRAEGLFNLISGVPTLAAPLLIPLVQQTLGAQAVLVFLGLVAALSLLALPGLRPGRAPADKAAGESTPH
ncbi:MFS transporter [Actinokineospora diospyrosa]|uniref:Arabinose efflux permease, MFS family n=1 Tax=Actinokineospora diospyrosa TaxID=103728 RepID=A0ABT1IJJ7_9PSEU|nr:MFS transporter [Actinokineospora diospyrosa]MCP2272706.1 putative arabinose efflux permease, MFS family [Actinokineospora diospyrosa]